MFPLAGERPLPHVVASAADYPIEISATLTAIFSQLETRTDAGISGHAVVELGLCSAAASEACARRRRRITGSVFQEMCVPWVNAYDLSRAGGVALCQVDLRQKLRLAGGEAELSPAVVELAEATRKALALAGEPRRNKTMTPEEERAIKLRRSRRDLKLRLRSIASIKAKRKDVKRAYESLDEQVIGLITAHMSIYGNNH